MPLKFWFEDLNGTPQELEEIEKQYLAEFIKPLSPEELATIALAVKAKMLLREGKEHLSSSDEEIVLNARRGDLSPQEEQRVAFHRAYYHLVIGRRSLQFNNLIDLGIICWGSGDYHQPTLERLQQLPSLEALKYLDGTLYKFQCCR